MKRAFLTFGCLTILAVPAQAQDTTNALCKILSSQTGIPSANYQPGVDVHGRPVVPADYNAPMSVSTDVVKIPLTVDLARRLSHPLTAGARMESDFGNLEIRKDGSVTYNGQDLTSQANIVCGRPQVQPSVKTPSVPRPPSVPAPQFSPPPPNAFIKTPGAKPADITPRKEIRPQPGMIVPESEPDEDAPPAPTITIREGSEGKIKKEDIIWGQGN